MTLLPQLCYKNLALLPRFRKFVYGNTLLAMFQILLAEDNPGDVLLFREALNSCGLKCNIIVAADGEKAIELTQPAVAPDQPAWLPDLIVLDVNLPKHDGDTVLRQIRSQARLKQVPVIMLTSSASPADRVSAGSLGATLYLQKSSDLDELLEVGKIVQAVLERSDKS